MKFEDRVEGAILGAVLGDCVANPYLFEKSKKLNAYKARVGWEVKDMSDESQLLMLGLATINDHGMKQDALIRAYQHWVKSSPVDLDHVMSTVFGVAEHLTARVLWSNAPEFDFGTQNSSSLLARQIPIVLTAWRKEDESRLMRLIDDATRLTHTDALTREVCQLYALTLAMALRGASKLHIWDALMNRVKTRLLCETIIESYYSAPRMDREDYSSNRITFQRVLHDLWHSQNFVSSIRSCILSGGGTDMNATAIGAVLGAHWGRHALPMPWMETLFQRYDAELAQTLQHALCIAQRKKRIETRTAESATPHTASRYVRPPQYMPNIADQSIHSSQSNAAIGRSSATLGKVACASQSNPAIRDLPTNEIH